MPRLPPAGRNLRRPTFRKNLLMEQKRLGVLKPFLTRSASAALAALLLAAPLCAGGPAPPPPGKLVDVGGWRIHVHCTGSEKPDAPTVVLESGSGGLSLDWRLVQPGVAAFARVCSYDRAGHAWSDLGPRPRTLKQLVYELHAVLAKLGVNPPYVLAGQSFGGLLARVFAEQYPKEVVGMVLVDSAHEDTRLYLNGKLQEDLLRLSSDSRQIIAETSGHHVQLDNPALVTDSIREVLEAAVRNGRLAPSR